MTDIDPADFLARLQGMAQGQKGRKPIEWRQCQDAGVVITFDESTGGWGTTPCPSCITRQADLGAPRR